MTRRPGLFSIIALAGFVALWLGFSHVWSPEFDSSHPAESITRLRESLPAEDHLKFENSVIVLLANQNIMLDHDLTKHELQQLFNSLDGKTAKEIMTEADDIVTKIRNQQ